MDSFANQIILSCSSTNDLAKKLAEEGHPHGTWISSREQTIGRGRLGRSWGSIQGNLFLSIVTRVENRSLWSWLPLTTAVAITEALAHVLPSVSVRIKWPNDLWIGQRKVGGILCEGSSGLTSVPGGSSIIIGIGLNCTEVPKGLETIATHLTAENKGKTVLADDLRIVIVQSVLKSIHRLETEGHAVIERAYQSRALFTIGSQVEWGQPESEFLSSGIIVGLGPHSELRLLNPQGTELKLFAEDVRPISIRPSRY